MKVSNIESDIKMGVTVHMLLLLRNNIYELGSQIVPNVY